MSESLSTIPSPTPNMILTADAEVVRSAMTGLSNPVRPAPVAASAFQPLAYQPPPLAQTYLLSAVQTVIAGCQTLAQQPIEERVRETAANAAAALLAAQPALLRPIDASTWDENATQAISMAQGVLPAILPFLGPAGAYVSLALMAAQMVVVMGKTVVPQVHQLHLMATQPKTQTG